MNNRFRFQILVVVASGLLFTLCTGLKMITYSQVLHSEKTFKSFESEPLVLKYGDVTGVKVVYDLKAERVYFLHGMYYKFHVDFCRKELGYRESHEEFNEYNYSTNAKQKFLLGNINYYESLQKYVLELSVANETDANQVEKLWLAIARNSFFGNDLKLLVNNKNTEGFKVDNKHSIPLISVAQLYGSQTYQPLNKKVGMGRLRFVEAGKVMDGAVGINDILVTNGSPNVLPVTKGIVTTQKQGPLSHITLLGINRGIPVMQLKDAWTDSVLRSYEGKLVRLEVLQNQYEIATVSQDEFDFFYRSNDKISIQKNLKVDRLLSIEEIDREDVGIVGGKAANFGELASIDLHELAKIPEGGFAIPFYFYDQHMQSCGAAVLLDSVLSFPLKFEGVKKTEALVRLQKLIRSSPVSPQLLSEIEGLIKKKLGSVRVRFRSSTNAEDIKGFNGAGLYTSKSGEIGSKKYSIEKAIQKVWASLWFERAFDERELFGIPQKDVAMGILVHRAFLDEKVNGVAITKNMYRAEYPGFTVSVQIGEESVVAPTHGVVCDHFIGFLKEDMDFMNDRILIDWISRSSLSDENVMDAFETERLLRTLRLIKQHYYKSENFFKVKSYYQYGLDIEFKIDKVSNQLYIKQVRQFNG